MHRFDDRKSALIVGAKRVGRTVAKRLAKEGIDLAIVYRRSEAEARALRDDLKRDPELPPLRTVLLQADISEEASVKRAVENAARQLGSLHYVVNLASDYPRTPFDSLDAASWDAAMASAKGAYLLAIHAMRHMAAQNPPPNRGHIIMFGDWAAEETPYTRYLPYLTSKAAIHFMTRGLAAEGAPLGVRVNLLALGPTARPPDIAIDKWQRMIDAVTPLQQEVSATDVAEMVSTLLGSSSITGEIIRVDSGRHIRGV